MHTVQYRSTEDLLDITWSGLFTSADMARYALDCSDIQAREGFKAGFRLRIWLRDGHPLPQESLAALAGAFTDFPKPSRQAWVTTSSLVRLQIKRTMLWSYARLFECPNEALAWLIGPDAN